MIAAMRNSIMKALPQLYNVSQRMTVLGSVSRAVSVYFPGRGFFSQRLCNFHVASLKSANACSVYSVRIPSLLHSLHSRNASRHVASVPRRLSSWPVTAAIQRLWLRHQSTASAPDVSSLTSDTFTKRTTRRTKKKTTDHRSHTNYKVTAFATAEQYHLESLANEAQQYGYTVMQLPEDAFDALLFKAVNMVNDEMRRIFLFREGSVVFWNITDNEQSQWLDVLCSQQDGAYDVEMMREEQEILDYSYRDGDSRLVSGDIELNRSDAAAQQLDMFAFSNALSSSVKLAVWEALLAQYVDSIEWVLEDLKEGKRIRMSEPEVLKKAGELFALSHFVNLSSDLLDTPDFYWDREELEILYSKTCNYLNIARRTRVMNEKLHQCVGLVELLRDHLKDKHHTRLELMIIILILIEVVYATFHMLEKYYFVNADSRDSVLDL